MENVNVVLVHLDDSAALLEFETENRQWFERSVPPRDNEFYSQAGVRGQIQEFLLYHRAGLMYPMLIKTVDGRICGRINVNVKEPKLDVAEIGYRVGYAYIKQGIASSALKQLLTQLEGNHQLKHVIAHASTSNVGSQRVLERNGFTQVKQISAFAKINNINIDVIEYQKMFVK